MEIIEEPLKESGISIDLQERYGRWKKNTKLLYDYLNTNTSKWPSLTCQFFPDLDTTTDTHRILLSSFTSSQLPEDEAIYISTISTSKHLNWASLNNFDIDTMEFKPDNSTKFPSKHLTTDITIKFPNGDCNSATFLPQNPDLIAGASSDGSIYIFNRTKHGSRKLRQVQDSQLLYEARFNSRGNLVDDISEPNEVLSIDWNKQKEGELLSSYSNGDIKIWDMKTYTMKNADISNTVLSFNFDAMGTNCVSWMPSHESLFAAAGESNIMSILDTRKKDLEINKINMKHHSQGINSCRFNIFNSMLLASADGNGRVNIWDIRQLDQEPVSTFEHGSSISAIEWNPNLETILATAGQEDGLVKIWDTSNSEPIFVHGGHMLGVNDVAWNAHDPWLMCSVANDNTTHIWKPARSIVDDA
ncbi:similar to Saccharomyces cerevisiae YBR195C MSI1 Subunit of chromatin assembly factor I (CAF- 1), negative regulator of the RAS/cAMP pathway via sequestration of Npr1p kinase [Maudiozyma barnettii]|uniref:Similar to Saccharomyces cerevisiae YBR195C MSI1 Subunit of chromatin assembly factor I (CAF- 1), negative regulator of the RAS/cAMP pathway via sequestration of Npr1p kinase n=1 Tax=Maudiozyma barnettii TaxID=61262 RepID=A0A8H2ZH88_9SACH|nr:Msi1p [Kazachstania barnettii]CAB4253683.1 similar to Saccharomyces cerevisiae YBR195C MSI1 Subunit of chromatin assembly factor I (CAF- 1), negative regulator of the RAS/cAMP pathway via sequestration of Npr1p kinase [Kazachstania barnettii]CAD1781400.1 similar to Saccharomyces cerevisiae YBR195C MSI1 Subunit of chromatin assembly factor I (CAF- 1), negative regulator of the RAS/cAMP pathway via sequestration of Npr1p kinase [Kazachstania barnettii]